MSPTLIFAMISILLAALLYSIAVFGERRIGILEPRHLALFWLGFVFDTTGTSLMAEIAGGWKWDIHGITGILAIALMLIHSIWATTAIALKQERVLQNFHKFSIWVWALWMFALVSGFAFVAINMI